MANLLDIKRRITSVRSTQKITRAMKMVAAAKLRRSQEAIVQARPYAYRLRVMLNLLAHRVESNAHPLLRTKGGGKIDLIVLTSDRGLCGGFNSTIIQETARAVEEDFAGREFELTVIGRKGIELFRRRSFPIRNTHAAVIDRPQHQVAESIADELAEEFAQGTTGEVYCVYNEFNSAISQNVTLERLLPFVSPSDTQALAIDFLYEPSPSVVFEALLLKHVRVQMHRMLLESAASEHGARMTAMDSATTNAGEMIDRLTLHYNRARQDAITTELIEVVSGSQEM